VIAGDVCRSAARPITTATARRTTRRPPRRAPRRRARARRRGGVRRVARRPRSRRRRRPRRPAGDVEQRVGRALERGDARTGVPPSAARRAARRSASASPRIEPPILCTTMDIADAGAEGGGNEKRGLSEVPRGRARSRVVVASAQRPRAASSGERGRRGSNRDAEREAHDGDECHRTRAASRASRRCSPRSQCSGGPPHLHPNTSYLARRTDRTRRRSNHVWDRLDRSDPCGSSSGLDLTPSIRSIRSHTSSPGPDQHPYEPPPTTSFGVERTERTDGWPRARALSATHRIRPIRSILLVSSPRPAHVGSCGSRVSELVRGTPPSPP
jgi:hypothetical protein